MARLINKANVAGNDAGMDDYSAIPADDYLAMIVDSEFKETKAKTGHYLKLKHKILAGEYKGRILWNNLNLDNPNPVAVEIANKTLNTICKACNKVGVEDSEELHGIPMVLKVVVEKATAAHPESNKISFYSVYEGGPIDDASTGASQPETTAEKSPQPGGLIGGNKKTGTTGNKSKLPWE